jgi:hypothetical protein
MTPMNRAAAELDVITAARNLLIAIDSHLQENAWPEMPFGVHCALVVLGERMLTLDEALAA